MAGELIDEVRAALAQFSSVTRLYALDVGDGNLELGAGGLLVEAFVADDLVQGVGARDVIAVSTSAFVELPSLLGQPASLQVSLADGTRTTFAGEVSEFAQLGSEGGLARYRVRISHWIWRLAHARNSRVWQDMSVTDIVDAVFGEHGAAARWRWSDEVMPFMEAATPRSYCCQYRETDLAFVERLLAEEGLAWRFEQGEDGPSMVLFADSSSTSGVPDDPSSAGMGIRFHGAHSREQSDTVQALASMRSVGPSSSTTLSYDYKSKKAVAATSPSWLSNGAKLPPLESFDTPGQYAHADGGQAQRWADLQMQAREARSQLWRGRSTVRTLRAGTRLTVTGAPLQRLGEAAGYTILRVVSVGVNNLPSKATEALAELFGPVPELLQEVARDVPPDFDLAIAQARKAGYANCFEAVASDVIWRPVLPGSDGRAHPKPTAHGAQTAIVVGADGGEALSGSDELYCDALGRVRIRYHWQDSGDATCWVRVAQRLAGGGIGSQFLPRIGQEVVVQFMENDIDRPIIVGAVYNGQGEGGVAPTPGGEAATSTDGAALFKPANDHGISAQGNLAGGNAPVWHGASGDDAGHRNATAQWGVRTKEFGGAGYNQLVFDDTDSQGRVQLRTTSAATELNLGHLIHTADNYRGSLRGHGAELRTDAYGAVRGGAGLLVSSYKIAHGAAARDPVGDNAAGIALMKQAVKLGETFSKAAVTHETVGLASHLGAAKASSSVVDEKAAPLAALLTAVSGMVATDGLDAAQGDAASRNISPGDGKVPHATDAVIAISAKAGLAVVAGQAMQLSNGETVNLMSGQDSQFVTGGQMRVQTGQAIGMLAGAVKPGAEGAGLKVIAAKDAIDVQAQADVLKVQARDEVNIASANAHIDWAAAKKISLSTADGANITIDGGNITVQCPGKIMVHAAKKSFIAPEDFSYKLPIMPQSVCVECLAKRAAQRTAFINKGA